RGSARAGPRSPAQLVVPSLQDPGGGDRARVPARSGCTGAHVRAASVRLLARPRLLRARGRDQLGEPAGRAPTARRPPRPPPPRPHRPAPDPARPAAGASSSTRTRDPRSWATARPSARLALSPIADSSAATSRSSPTASPDDVTGRGELPPLHKRAPRPGPER